MPRQTDKTSQDNTSVTPSKLLRTLDMAKKYSDTARVLRKSAPTMSKLSAATKGVPTAAVAAAAIDLATLASSKKARDKAAAAVESDAQQSPAILRAFKGFTDPINTGYGIGTMLSDLAESTYGASKAKAREPSDKDLAARYMEARRRSEMRKARRNTQGDDYREEIIFDYL
jgi:hypothetical protein